MRLPLLMAGLVVLVAFVGLAPTASASILHDCVWTEQGDPVSVNVSPSGCYEKGRPAWDAWNEQCPWITGNPALPPDTLRCRPL